jgi:hypothetical protein
MSLEFVVGLLAKSFDSCLITTPDVGFFKRLFKKGGFYRGRTLAGAVIGHGDFAFSFSAALALFLAFAFALSLGFAFALALAVLAFALLR